MVALSLKVLSHTLSNGEHAILYRLAAEFINFSPVPGYIGSVEFIPIKLSTGTTVKQISIDKTRLWFLVPGKRDLIFQVIISSKEEVGISEFIGTLYDNKGTKLTTKIQCQIDYLAKSINVNLVTDDKYLFKQ
jgi:hypothetical protein